MADINKVIFKKGLFANLPSSAEANVLFFCTDTGQLFQGSGLTKPLVEYGSVLGGYADLDDLKLKNPQIKNKLYLTTDKRVYTYDGIDYALVISDEDMHKHENLSVLDKITSDEVGNLLFDGKKIESDISQEVLNEYLKKEELPSHLDGYMKKEEFASSLNVGSVNKADSALKIDGVDIIQPSMYYGKNESGEIGFHYISKGSNEGGQGEPNEPNEPQHGLMEQHVILNAISGQIYNIESTNDMSEGKAFVQAYKYIQGEQDIIKTVKAFNNGEKENFYYDENNILFNETSCTIKNEFDVVVTLNETLYETNLIDKTEFVKMRLDKRESV